VLPSCDYREDRRSTFLRNSGDDLPHHTASYLRKQKETFIFANVIKGTRDAVQLKQRVSGDQTQVESVRIKDSSSERLPERAK
jgi:hypothetical protein